MPKYGTPNFKAPSVAVGARSLDEKTKAAQFKKDMGFELTWAEEWLLRDYIGGIRVDEEEKDGSA